MQEETNHQLLIKNIRVVLREQLIEGLDIWIEDGRIAGITESTGRDMQGITVANGIGLTLFPGFIDLHIHGAVGVDILSAKNADLQKVSRFLAAQGVTGWLPTFVPAEDKTYTEAVNIIEKVHQEPELGARVLGVHYEGPFVNALQCGALHAEHFKSYSGPADLDALKTLTDSSAVKMITVAPEIQGGVKLVSELKQQGWIVSIGHTRADVETLDLAFSAGARHMTHFMNAMAPLHQRSPGPIGWGLSRDDVSCDVIADGIHLDPRILRLLLKVKTPQCLILISDAIAAAGQDDGDYQIWGETITVADRVTHNAKGSLAGSVITILDAVRLMLSMGVSENDVALMASTNPAELIGIAEECGSIEVGKRADLVALDREKNVRLTLVGGVVAFSDL